MKVLITGGAGFIGSHLARFYLARGDDVLVIDDLSSGKKETIKDLISHPRFQFTQGDLCDFPLLDSVVRPMDFIFHMAAIVGQKKVLTHPVEVLSTNIKSTERLLESVAKGKKGARILLASSSCVYDALPAHVHKEESVDLSMHSGQYLQQTYPLSKLVGEVMGLAFEAHRQVDCIMARLFNVIGPGQTGRYGMVVPTLLRQALHQEPMTIYGDGKQTRSFCYVEDIVRMLHHLMQNPKSRGQIVNVGSQEELSIASLAHLIKETLKSSSKVVYIPYEEAYKVPFEDVKRRCPDLTKLTSLIGPFQATSLDETLQKMLEKPGEL